MENERSLKEHIREKLRELDNPAKMQDAIWKDRISFGMESAKYAHLPAWKELVRKKKKLVRSTWINAYIVSLIIVFYSQDVVHNFSAHWVKTLVSWMVVSAIVMLFYVISYYYNIFFQVRDAETEARKLIYQDLLDQIKKVQTAEAS
ncbi:MAG TPA: hypothetical protein VNR87_02045 [Flavisolibacter sp.]|nr:hypothetical protein [Flavisolibacter sp.]